MPTRRTSDMSGLPIRAALSSLAPSYSSDRAYIVGVGTGLAPARADPSVGPTTTQRMGSMARAALIGLLLILSPPDSHSRPADSKHTGGSVAQRVAPADTPLNLVETPDGFLISTNSGYGAHYLQAYDEHR